MIKRFYFLFLTAALLIPQVSTAQFMGFSIKSNNQIFIEQALQQAFVKLSQSYHLKDTVHNEIFGRDGKDYFSIIPFLGLRTQQGILVSQYVTHPWQVDEDFKGYESKYLPQVFRSTITYLHSGLGSNEANPIVDESNVKLLDHSPFALYTDSLHQQGIACDTVFGAKSGWMVWITNSTTANHEDSIQFISYKKELYIKAPSDTLSIDTPDLSQPVMGGIYVSPVSNGLGQVSFHLTGVALNEDNRWILYFPFLRQPEKEKDKLTIIQSVSKHNQLPKKKKK